MEFFPWTDPTTGNAMFTQGTLANDKLPINVGVCGLNTGDFNGTINWIDSSGSTGTTSLLVKCPTNIWGSGSDGDATLATTTNLCTDDATNATCIKQYKNLTINSGVTVSTAIAKKGLILYVNGNLTLNGSISMTNRGASGDVGGPLTIHRIKSGGGVTSGSGSTAVSSSASWANIESKQPALSSTNVGVLFTFPRQGASGGAGVVNDKLGSVGGSGNANTSYSLITGGGGSGGAVSTPGSASGSYGSPFTGGSASSGSTWQGSMSAATAYGGAAGTSSTGNSTSCGGGAGNPGAACNNGVTGTTGTGGLIIIFVKGSITGSGNIVSTGGAGGNGGTMVFSTGGGGSGGGAILVVHSGVSNLNSSKISVSGGANGGTNGGTYRYAGGAGGSGSWKTEQVTK